MRRKTQPKTSTHDFCDLSLSGRRARVSGRGKKFIGTVYSYVRATKRQPVFVLDEKLLLDMPAPLTESYFVVVDDHGRSHYAEPHEVELMEEQLDVA